MGRQSVLHFVLSVVLTGLFAMAFLVAGLYFRHRWWIGVLPLLVIQNVCMNLLGRWLPDAPQLTQLDSVQLGHFHQPPRL